MTTSMTASQEIQESLAGSPNLYLSLLKRVLTDTSIGVQLMS